MKKSMIGFLVMVICASIALIVDGFFNWNCPDHSVKCTVSYLLWYQAYSHPVIPWLIGFGMGCIGAHLFWNTNPVEPPDPNQPPT
jgi:hypothetical protein